MKKTNNFKKVIASFALITMCVSPVATSALSVKNVYNSAYNTCSSAYNYIYNWIFGSSVSDIKVQINELMKCIKNNENLAKSYKIDRTKIINNLKALMGKLIEKLPESDRNDYKKQLNNKKGER